MAIKNSLQPQTAAKPTFTSFITAPKIQAKTIQAMGKVAAQRFTTSIISAVTTNPALAECDFSTIYSAAMLGEALKLSPSPQLGQFYMVPFNDKNRGVKVAQFQLGYKGYIQLAIRSGYYKKLNVISIKEGELIRYDPLNEDIEVNLIEDDTVREQAETIGYYACFEYQNGFKKAMYWSKTKMLVHADKYSQAFHMNAVQSQYPKSRRVSYADFLAGNFPKEDAWKYSSFWYKDFDGMAYKTMLRQLISRWGIMSIEMQNALDKDMAAINEDGTVDYVDNQPDTIEAEYTEHPEPADPITAEESAAPVDATDPAADFFNN